MPFIRLPDWFQAALRLLLLQASVGGWCVAAQGEETDVVRLRVAWGGGTPARWVGRMSLSQGKIGNLQLLGREPDTPGSIWSDNGEVRFLQPRPRGFDGFDLTATAPRSATLRMEWQSSQQQGSQVMEIPLAELLSRKRHVPLDDQGNMLLIHRARDDALRLQVEEEDLIFAPGATLRLQVEPAIAGIAAGSSLDLTLERGGASEWSRTQRVTLPGQGTAKVPWEVPLPLEEGVYDVRVAASLPAGHLTSFWGNVPTEPLAERHFQVVVLAEQPARSYRQASWKTVLEIDPANPRWWNRLPSWTRLSRWSTSRPLPVGEGPFRTTQWQGQALAEMAASQQDKPSWRAYPLFGAQPGEPHVVEILLPNDLPQQLAFSLYEEDDQGRLTVTASRSGVAVASWPPVESAEMTTYRWIFWPRTAKPLLVLQNASQTQAAKYGTISLQVAEATSSLSSATEIAATKINEERLVAAYFSWPGLLARMNAQRPAQEGGVPVDDWQTFYETAERLASYLELQGYNGAVVNVLADGGCAFDCPAYQSTPLLNASRLASGMDDLPAYDPVKLLLLAFERRGLRLMPTLEFNATLPGIEALLRQQAPTEPLPVWTDGANHIKPTNLAVPASPPHYDLTHPAVQQEIQQIVQSLLQAYRSHPALAGVGIELTAESYLPLPLLPVGLTSSRLKQLAAQTGASQEQLQQWLADPRLVLRDAELRRQGNQLRAAPVTQFYQQLAEQVQASHPQASLTLLTADLLAGREFLPLVRPQLLTPRSVEELYLERGLAWQALQHIEGLAIPLPHHRLTALPLSDAAVGFQLNQLAQHRRSPSFRHSTWIVEHARSVQQLSLDSPEQPMATSTVDVPFTSLGAESCAPLLTALGDEAGGPLLVGSSQGPADHSLAGVLQRKLLRQLPWSTAEETRDQMQEQPVVVRTFRHEDQTLCVALNPSPWSVQAILTLNVGQRTEGIANDVVLPTGSPVMHYAAGQHAWAVKLKPGEFQTLRFSSAQVALAGVRTELAPLVQQQLATRCRAMERRDFSAASPYQALKNPSFEQLQPQDGSLQDWGVASGELPPGSGLIATPAAVGERALRLQSLGPPLAIASEPFRVPPTGQLALTAYVKAVQLTKETQLRFVLEEIDSPAPPRFILLPAERLRHDRESHEWTGYQFGVEDLPLDSTATMRVRMELVGSGEVWVDDLKLYDVVFPLDLYPESQQQVLALVQHLSQAQAALEERRYSDCLELTSSYWSQFLLEYLPPSAASENGVAHKQVPPPAEPPEHRTSRKWRDLFRF